MRSSRLNILAAELFSLVTQVQPVTGWSQLCPSLVSSGAKSQVAPTSKCAPRQPSWSRLLQLILSSLEEQGGHLTASTFLLSEQTPEKPWQCKVPQDTPSYCPLFLLLWSLKRVLVAWCQPTGNHPLPLLSPNKPLLFSLPAQRSPRNGPTGVSTLNIPSA